MKLENEPSDADRIRKLKAALTRAIREKNVGGYISLFADNSRLFLLAPPLKIKADAARPEDGGIRAWFDSFVDKIGYEPVELEISAGDTIAFCHSLDRISGRRIDGSETDLWVRETLCFEKIEGRWKIAHQHQSVPFYMDGSGRAALDLKPVNY